MPKIPRTPEARRLAAEKHRLAKAERDAALAQRFLSQAEVVRMTWDAIRAKQSSLPAWLLRNADYICRQSEAEVWICTIFLYRKIVLKPGDAWERNSDGSKTMVHIHSETGQKRVVILYDVPDEDRIPIVEAEVNIATRQVTFLQESELTSLNADDFELYYE